MKRVVITGAGVISSVGNNTEEFWNNLLAGNSGVVAVEEEWLKNNPDAFKTKVYAPVKNFKPEHIGVKEKKRTDIGTQFSIEAAYQALQNAGIEMKIEDEKELRYVPINIDGERTGVIIGSGRGSGSHTEMINHAIYARGDVRDVNLLTVPISMVNADSAFIAKKFGFYGPNRVIATACASGTDGIGTAYEQILLGKADVIISGGAENLIRSNGFHFYLFDRMTAMSRNFNDQPKKASRPFDKERDGFVMSEGAGIVVLESLDHAMARGAPILAEVIGYNSTSDAYDIVAPEPSGRQIARLMKGAIISAGLSMEEIDYINAHGTSTPLNDKTETIAIKNVFGNHAYKLLVNSTKSMTGHSIGASGSLEAIATALSLKTGKIHPTINQEFPDPECDLNYVPNVAIESPIKFALSSSYGFGGHNATLLLAKYE